MIDAMLCDASIRLAVLRREIAAMKNCVSGATVEWVFCKWEDSGKAGGIIRRDTTATAEFV